MATPDEKKTLLKRGFTKRAGKKVRNLLQRARGNRKTNTDDADEIIENPSMLTNSSNNSQSSLEEEEYEEYNKASSSKDSKFTADSRSRKSSSTSFDHYFRQRAIIKPSESRSRTMSLTSASEYVRPKGVFNDKQSSSIVVVPAAAPGPSPPISPTSVPATSEYSLTRSVEELSVASEKEVVVVAKEEPATNNGKEEEKKEEIPVMEDGSYVLPTPTTTTTVATAAPTPTTPTSEASPTPMTPTSEASPTTTTTTTETSLTTATPATETTLTTTTPATETSLTTATPSTEVSPTTATVSTTAVVTTTPNTGELEVSKRVAYFDKKHRGKITMLDTLTSLRELGYHWMVAIPATLIMHFRLSPLTIHHPLSLREWFSLPIYTDRVAQALANHTPLIHRREQVSKWVDLYGRRKDSVRGLTFWDGFRALRGAERTTLRWWQIRLWLAHRLQWILTYSMLHDPQTRMVTQPALEYLCPSSDCKQ